VVMRTRQYEAFEERGALRVAIGGEWTSADFARFFSEMENLHVLAKFGFVKIDGQSVHGFRPYLVRRPGRYWPDTEFEEEVDEIADRVALDEFLREFVSPDALHVSQIEFASPGFTDLAGAGRAIAELRKFLFGIADRFIASKDRELERESRRQSILKEKIANAERLLKLADKSGMDVDTKNRLVKRALEADYFIESMILQGKVTEVTQLDGKGNPVT
jgi:hypothetical protein